jgi:diguanylate cyclase (GGDEF)-like protein
MQKSRYDVLDREELIRLLERRDKEIDKLKHAHQISARDELTNAYNRNSGFELINKKLTRGNNIVICLLDMNNLKKINDQHGHVEGDNSIRLMVNALENAIDDKKDFIVRIGGDEFLIVFSRSTIATARRKVEKAKRDLQHVKKNHSVPITFSAGFIDCNKHQGKSIKELLDKVDKTMYKNKRHMKAKHGIESYR